MLDLQLMHDFTNSTYATFSRHQVIRSFWKGPLVAMALQCDYLMRALLATSALHITHNMPEEKEFYVSTALTYHRAASREAVVLLADIKKESAEELFMFSILTIVIGKTLFESFYSTANPPSIKQSSRKCQRQPIFCGR